MRTWMSRFYGVGTAYLPNYLGWNRLMDISKEEEPLDLKGLVCDGFYWQPQEE